MIRIGPHELRNPVILAPMAGITDLPFRKLAWSQGAGHLVGEMLSDNPALWNTEKSRTRRVLLPNAGAKVIQIAGSDPVQVAAAAVQQWRAGADIVDLNFGCPAKKVCRKAAGSALLAEPELVQTIAAAAVNAVPIPVTAKIRTGPSPDNRNGVDIAQRLEAAGIAAIAVHGRTRACRFVGAVELDTLAAIKQSVLIPVFANGDICTVADAQATLDYTAADAVMVGRGALGAPWRLGQMAQALGATTTGALPLPNLTQAITLMRSHVAHMHEFYGAESGLRIARKHIGWYMDGLNLRGVKSLLLRLPLATQQLDVLDLLAHTLCGLGPGINKAPIAAMSEEHSAFVVLRMNEQRSQVTVAA